MSPYSPLQKVTTPASSAAGVELFVKRDDLLDPFVCGNKWRKLIPQLQWLVRKGAEGFASLGGRHSNHLPALAAQCKRMGIPCIGFVRGGIEEELSASLAFCRDQGMLLKGATRTQIRQWRNSAPAAAALAGMRWIPEGGTSRLGMLGMAECHREVVEQLKGQPDAYLVAMGSGGTAAGLARKAACQVYGVDVVGDADLGNRIHALLGEKAIQRLEILAFEGSRFASGEPELYRAMQDFKKQTGILLDPIYTIKVHLTLNALLAAGRFKPGSRLVFVHTGGLQGLPAWLERYGYAALE